MSIHLDLPDLSRWIPPEQILKELPETVLATIENIKCPKTKQLGGGIDSSFRRLFFVTEDYLRSAAWLRMTPKVSEFMKTHSRYVDGFIGLDYQMSFAFRNLRSFVVDISLKED